MLRDLQSEYDEARANLYIVFFVQAIKGERLWDIGSYVFSSVTICCKPYLRPGGSGPARIQDPELHRLYDGFISRLEEVDTLSVVGEGDKS